MVKMDERQTVKETDSTERGHEGWGKGEGGMHLGWYRAIRNTGEKAS